MHYVLFLLAFAGSVSSHAAEQSRGSAQAPQCASILLLADPRPEEPYTNDLLRAAMKIPLKEGEEVGVAQKRLGDGRTLNIVWIMGNNSQRSAFFPAACQLAGEDELQNPKNMRFEIPIDDEAARSEGRLSAFFGGFCGLAAGVVATLWLHMSPDWLLQNLAFALTYSSVGVGAKVAYDLSYRNTLSANAQAQFSEASFDFLLAELEHIVATEKKPAEEGRYDILSLMYLSADNLPTGVDSVASLFKKREYSAVRHLVRPVQEKSRVEQNPTVLSQ